MTTASPSWWARFVARIENISAPETEPRPWVRALAGVPLPALALLLQPLVSGPEHRLPWILFYPAIFFSGWLGGLATGLTATLLSVTLVGWFILPAQGPIGGFWLVQMLLVLLIGTLGSMLFERYRRTIRQLRAVNRSLDLEAARLVAAERLLHDARGRLQLAADSAGIATWSIDVPTGRTTWDDRMMDLFEVPQDRRSSGIDHEFFRSRIHPDDRGRIDEDIAQAGARGSGGQSYRICLPGGRIRTVQDTWLLSRDDVGRALAMTGTCRDITAEVEVAADLRRAKEAAERSERAKSEFLSAAAHELRTPMTSVHGFAELLASREFDRETTRSIALTIHRQSSLLVQMVNELLDLARIESGRGLDFAMKRQPLLPIVRDTVETVIFPDDPRRPELQPGTGDSAWVVVDEAKLRQAVTNVASNAFKYSAGKGAVRITLPVRMYGARDEVGIRVEDQGRGMTPEQLSRAFERFYRAEPAGTVPGTGLGLALTKEIIEAMHGHVEMASEPGRGTHVTLWLRRVPASDERA